MDETTIKEALRSDVRVKELIATRAYQLYQSRAAEIGSAEEDWYQAEEQIINDLTSKLVEAQQEFWQALNQQQPTLQVGRSFATLVGFMLAKSGLPTQAELYDVQYFTIGLSYITGLFQMGRLFDEAAFLRHFANDSVIVQALRYRLRSLPESPYFTPTSPGEPLKLNDEELKEYLAYAEREIAMLFEQFKTMLLGQAASVGV
ncbi:MAG: DUF2934 domain-containing protein [Acidobacteriota bacterium]